jgi:hypothetical protein
MDKTEVVKKFAEQVRRSLDVERIKGYEFPDKCDVGTLVLSYTPTSYKVKARIDNMSIEATIKKESEAKDIMETVGHLVEPWLISYATKKP